MLVPDVPTILLLESYTFDRVPHVHKECEWRGSVLPKCSIYLSNHQSKIQVIICPCEACYILKSKAEVKSNEHSTFPCVCTQSLGHVRLGATPWTVAHQAPLSMGFPRQEDCSGLPFPPPGGVLHPGAEPRSPALAGEFFTTGPLGGPPPCSHEYFLNSRVLKRRKKAIGWMDRQMDRNPCTFMGIFCNKMLETVKSWLKWHIIQNNPYL